MDLDKKEDKDEEYIEDTDTDNDSINLPTPLVPEPKVVECSRQSAALSFCKALNEHLPKKIRFQSGLLEG